MDENGDRNPIELPVPEGAMYGGYPITEIAYSPQRDNLHVVYEGEDLPQGWDQIVFTNCERRDGTPVVKAAKSTDDYPADLVFPEEAREGDTPGANQSEAVRHAGGGRGRGGRVVTGDPSPRRR